MGKHPTWGIRVLILLGEAKIEYNIIFQRIFSDIPFIGYYRLEDIPYSGVICNTISYFFFAPRIPHVGHTHTCTPMGF